MARKGAEQMNDNKTFEEIFEELARHNDRSVIWNDWLNYAIEVNLLTLSEDKKGFHKNYHGNEEAYWDMTSAWLTELSQKLEQYSYYDILGEFYEELVQSRAKGKQLGQMYTPPSVTTMLSEIAFDKNHDYNNKIVNDPAGGSGRTLLAAHVQTKGEIFCISGDVDETSCMMCVLNFFSHGVRGSVLHQDALTQEFWKGWRINRYLYHGVGIPHIEPINNPKDAYDFIELNRLSDEEKTEAIISAYSDDSHDEDGDEEVAIPKQIVQTGQTTLI